MIHKACMPVYMNSGKIVADGTGRVGKSKVLQEVLADLKSTWAYLEIIALLSNKFNSNVTFLTKGFNFQMFFEVKREHF